MLKIKDIAVGSVASLLDIAPNDELLSINGHEITDLIDYQFHQAYAKITLRISRNGQAKILKFSKEIDKAIGLVFYPDKIIRCRNKCVFCFVSNNPRNMRKSLYVRDDDYRLSFMHGNFVTLTNLTEIELQRIIAMRLSPLYISVQATDDAARKRLFGKKGIPPILPLLIKLASANIQFHSQVVVAPSYNDGEILRRTIADLAKLQPHALSVAIVPVGLTRFCVSPIKSVKNKKAIELISEVDKFRRQYGTKENRFVYAADELFIAAVFDIPPAKYYDDYPQIENGVGLVRQFMDTIPRKLPSKISGYWVTGQSMVKVWRDMIIPGNKFKLSLVPVTNRLFGSKVTVTGLLPGNDILRALSRIKLKGMPVVLPPNCLNDDGKFIDDMTPEEMSEILDVEIVQGTYDFAETVQMLT
jgi:putative radical SAM enzyme (TIGR03279 family)